MKRSLPFLGLLLSTSLVSSLAMPPAAAEVPLSPAPSHAASAGEEKLVLVGGGDRSSEAMARFVEWAGGPKSRILLVLWATSVPDETSAGLLEDLAPHKPGSVESAPLAPLTPDTRLALLAQIQSATGIFFSGGDQNRIMEALQPAPEVLQALRDKYHSGAVFGGTSAGTAVMSDPMITGEGDFTVLDGKQVGVAPGLGLVPGVITDQHFVKRQRQNRLFGLILLDPTKLGLGINQDTAVLLRGGRHAEVVGAGPALVVEAKPADGALLVHVLKPGDRFDLQTRKRE